MPDPIADRDSLFEALRLVEREAERYLAAVDEALVRPPGSPAVDGALPAHGVGSLQAVTELLQIADEGATRSTGPRFFHFVMGGVTPAALGADWLTSTLNQSAYNWVSSPLGSRIEQVALSWMKELFGIPAEWSAVMTTAATTANLVGLAAARRWWAERHGVDVDERGFAGLPAAPIFAGRYLHASAVKAVGMLPSVRRLRVRARRAQPEAGRDGPRGWSRLLRHHRLRRQGRVPARDRQLAHHGKGCRPDRRGRARARRSPFVYGAGTVI